MFATSHLHPMLVHFPIALVTFGFFALIVSLFIKKESAWSKTAYLLLLFGTLGAMAAWLTGQLFTEELEGSAGKVKDTHELFANISLGLLIITSIVHIFLNRKKSERLKWIMVVLYALATVSISITGLYGGNLVYSYMMPL